jgi:hypothetical protein
MANAQTVALIAVVTRHHIAKGRPRDCPLLVWLQDQAERDPDTVREEMTRRPEWEPVTSYEALTIATTPSAQAIYARALANADWAKARVHIEHVFRDPAVTLTQQAAAILAAKIAASHPNPKAFLMQAHVRQRLAAGVTIDVSAMKAPDFPDLAKLRGALSRTGLAAR